MAPLTRKSKKRPDVDENSIVSKKPRLLQAEKKTPVKQSGNDSGLELSNEKKPSVSKKSASEGKVEHKKSSTVKRKLDSSNISKKNTKGGCRTTKKKDDLVKKIVENDDQKESINEPSTSKTVQRIKKKLEPISRPVDVRDMDVSQLLALGEGVKSEDTSKIESDSDSQSDWEEVEDIKREPEIPKDGVAVTLEGPILIQKRRKHAMDIDSEVRKQLGRVRRELQLLIHKVHLLGWIAHLRFVNSSINSQLLMALTLSIIPDKKLYPPKRADINYLEKISKWFRKTVEIEETESEGCLLGHLKKEIVEKKASSNNNFVLMFVILLRTFGLKARIVINFITVPLRPPTQNGKLDFEKKKKDDKSNVLKEEKKKNSQNAKKSKKENTDSDEEFSKHFKSPKKKKLSKKNSNTIDRRVLSSDDETNVTKSVVPKTASNVWVEVFLEAEEKWICVDIVRQKVHCVSEIYGKMAHPVAYIVACNNDGTMKDVTKRYVPHWHSDTRKRRVDNVDSKWWQTTMAPYKPRSDALDRLEDEDIASQLHDMPLPTSISEYKSHPLYALKRHLLKFEGIYPPEPATLGFIRGEPVYSRSCVVTLRSRDIWFKEARVVKAGETPYKIVKSRPKYDKMTGDVKRDLPLEIFGIWQTEEYIPPTAQNGIVPRNEYGNVDLFKPCMLPFGTVHLQIPNLLRVARKLNIDCAPAIVGFEFHSGGSHPVHDGFVVCEEFKNDLVEAWSKEVDESARRNEEKRMKRVLKNWRRLIRGLYIREKLKLKYAFGEDSDSDETTESSENSKVKAAPSKKKKVG